MLFLIPLGYSNVNFSLFYNKYIENVLIGVVVKNNLNYDSFILII